MALHSSARMLFFCAPIALASAASAQELTWSYGVDLTSNYISNGVSQTDGKAAVQPWVEAQIGNFYFGTWMSNVDFGAGDRDTWETDLYAGYRNAINDQWSYDLGYARYFYDATGNDSGEIIGQLTYSPVSNLDLTGYVAYDPDSEFFNYRMEAGYGITDVVSVNGEYGHSEYWDHDYWSVGATYAFTNQVAANVSYFGKDGKDEGLVATVNFAF